MNKEEIQIAYSKFIGRNYEDWGLVAYNKIPTGFIDTCNEVSQ